MSKQIDITEYIEPIIDVDISTQEAIDALKQNFKENIEAGAPRELVLDIHNAIRDTYTEIHGTYMKYLANIKK